ncbi:hypothetical protein LTR70_009872 [Exophiala xenobiotica]|uniref:Uncharacterized protein n=1 Tax=Lithohypha guttulata TaxID=1690604 RepID=A0ABR0JXZ8_9EURO|nr:hypothetical protein LTR24_009730 [Lithohypha guttulata]KAK5309939.1 hypothetical protein LTR70_009872 [Exophiala xenobiotica]
MDVLGNALTLYDLGIRIAAFINGLRHAQDDFLGLRAEADCLRICVNSLGSESCQDALYHYISVKQREDLKLIIANTLLNMKDLNEFLGSCKYLVEKEAKKKAKRQRKRDRWKDFLKEAWATYKFAMTDPQPFRDKLALPTASINIFLTSMTHVGLANVGNLLALSGHMPMAGGVGGSAPPRLGAWEVIGQKVAFKRANAIAGADLTVDLEEEIVRYVLHLLKGGAPFHTKEPETKTKTGRSKSITKDTGSGTYVMRRKTAYVPGSSRRTELVETEAWSSRDRIPPRLTVPASPSTPSSPRLLHIELPPSSPSSPRIIHAEPHFDLPDDGDRQQERAHRSPRRQSAPAQEAREAHTASSRTRSHQYPDARPDDLKSSRQYCRTQVEQEIKQEQEDAVTELRSKSAYMKSERRTRLFQTLEVEAKEEEDESDVEDVMELLDEEYGLKVERLYSERETIDNGTVAPIVPTSLVEPGEAQETEGHTIPPQRSRGSRLKSETSFYQGPRRTTSSRYHSHYQPYDIPKREAYLQRQTKGSRYRPDHFDHDFRYDSDGSPPSEQGPMHQQRSSYPEIIIKHHDDAGPSKKKHAKEPKPRLDSNELRRTVSDSGTKHTPYIILKRSQGAPDENIYMHGARSRASSHHSHSEDGSAEDPDGESMRTRS